jgi:hypothetical protein
MVETLFRPYINRVAQAMQMTLLTYSRVNKIVHLAAPERIQVDIGSEFIS